MAAAPAGTLTLTPTPTLARTLTRTLALTLALTLTLTLALPLTPSPYPAAGRPRRDPAEVEFRQDQGSVRDAGPRATEVRSRSRHMWLQPCRCTRLQPPPHMQPIAYGCNLILQPHMVAQVRS